MAGTLKHAFTSAAPEGATASKVRTSNWNADHNFAGGALGSLLYRDTGASDGASWLADVATGSVVVSGGVGAAPAWSATPTLSSLTLSITNGATAVVVTKHDPTITGTVGTAAGNVGGFVFGALYQPVRFTNGPGGSENYIDDTWHVGMNLGTLAGGVGRADATKPNLSLSYESKFYDGTRFGQEFHVQGVTSDGLTTFRPMGFFIAHDASDIGVQFTGDRFLVSSKAGIGQVQVTTANASMDLGTSAVGIKLRFVKNNSSAVQQLDAAGSSYVNLLYLDGGNVANIAAPLYVVAARAGAAAPVPGSFAVFQPTSANTNDIMLLLAGPTVTGNLSGVVARAQASALLQQEFNNQGAGDSRVLVAVEGAGDPTIKFEVNGGGRFSVGIDNSDGDKLKISTGVSVGSGDVLTILAAGNVGIGTTSPNANAILDLSSTTMPFMPPRMTTTQRDAVASPTAGMVVYNSTTNKLNVYTTAWEAVTSA